MHATVIKTASPATDRQLSGSCLQQPSSVSVKPESERLQRNNPVDTQSSSTITAESQMFLFLGQHHRLTEVMLSSAERYL